MPLTAGPVKTLTLDLPTAQVVSSVWNSSSPARGLQHAIDMDDSAVLVDVLGAAQPRLHSHLNLELAADLLPPLTSLVESEYEDYMLAGLGAAASVLKAVGHLLRDAAEAAANPGLFRGGVDLQFEERQDRCAALGEAFLALRPRLGLLSDGRGRSAQLAARVAKSLDRCLVPTADES